VRSFWLSQDDARVQRRKKVLWGRGRNTGRQLPGSIKTAVKIVNMSCVSLVWFHTQFESESTRRCVPLTPETRTLEECSVAGVGKFTAFSDGSLRVVYGDRTCLDMQGLRWEPHVYNRLHAQNIVSFSLWYTALLQSVLRLISLLPSEGW